MRTTAEGERPAAPSRRTSARGRGRTEAAPAEAPAAVPEEVLAAAQAQLAVTHVRLIRVDEGLYALRIGEIGGASGSASGLTVPAAQVSVPFGEDGRGVEIVASFPRRGNWIGREGGTVILRSPAAGGQVVVTAYGTAGEDHAEGLAVDLHRLDGPDGLAGEPAGAAGPRAAGLTGTRDVATEILLHIERLGDRLFPGRGWVGALGRRMRIEGFSIRPIEQLAPNELEMKGFLPNGGETPWVPGGTLCGTRGRGLPLIGFALRIVPHRADRFDVVYQGSFFSGGISEQLRNGSPCRAGADDPLEAINVRLIERVPEDEADAEDDEEIDIETTESAE
jgi:hypothetical protein